MKPDKTVAIYAAVGVAAIFLVVVLWDKIAKGASDLIAGGGVVDKVGDLVLGEPAKTGISTGTEFALTPEDLDKLTYVPLGLWAVFQTPNWGAIVNRTSYFGSEIEFRFTLKNLNKTARTVDLSLRAIETDLQADPARTTFLEKVTIPGQTGIVINGSYRVETRTIITGRLDVQLTVLANGTELVDTFFEVA